MYFEDDIRLSFENFCYFVEFREHLRRSGLLPAFVRMEYSSALTGFVASDAFWPVYVPVQAHIRIGDSIMVNMPNPYNPCLFLMLNWQKNTCVQPLLTEQRVARSVPGAYARERRWDYA